MAHEQHTRFSVTIEGTREYGDGFTAKIATFALDGDYMKAANMMIKDGCKNVGIVNTKITWKGRNGKRKHEVVERVPIGPQEDLTT